MTPCDRSGATAAERTFTSPIDPRPGSRALGDLDALAGDRGADQHALLLVRDAAEEVGQRAGGPGDAEAAAVLVLGQHHDGAVGLEEAGGVLGDLVDDAVELDGLGEDVAQLLEREELADAAVELSGEKVGPRLGLARPPAGARDGDPESRGDGDQRDGGEPPRPAVRRPDDDAEQRGTQGVKWTSHCSRHAVSTAMSAPASAGERARHSRGRPPNSTASRVVARRAPAEIPDGER